MCSFNLNVDENYRDLVSLYVTLTLIRNVVSLITRNLIILRVGYRVTLL